MSLATIIKDCLTESDGITHDVFRYLSIISVAVGLGLSIYAAVHQKAFNMLEFGGGVGALLGGAGVALGLKKETPVDTKD